MTKQAMRVRWVDGFEKYRFEDEDGYVALQFTDRQAAAEHHYRMWSENKRLQGIVDEAVEAERAACAEAAVQFGQRCVVLRTPGFVSQEIAAAIRARKDKES